MVKRSSEHTAVIKKAKTQNGVKCEICGSTINVHGHHIIDVALGGEADIKNILVVCKKCHDGIHNGDIKIDTYDYE